MGANLEEAQAAHSHFICKTGIALKEARETNYWLRLIVRGGLAPPTRIAELQAELGEPGQILGAMVVSAKRHVASSES